MSVGTYFPGRGTYRETAYLEGQADGQAKERGQLILRVLDQRLVPVPAETRDRITACTDLDTLGLWLDRAFSAKAVEDLFVEDDERGQG
ncbi:hypothetical protein [Streptomyces beijiangensis]|uniref:DUF4351 domain-containing protein n=1 Tax=Streptomyces beijiangensis TaxID=163361 RepID=A0A939FEC7_9ACTN|nr:hypothetical protein [Streptomyces beijiangensis]MBO0515475.1 hypothetical protein [Streptomyces beijiangensis]